jgi:Flp pilus assembly pilin Flp
MFTQLHRLLARQDGQDLIEYALLVALIALATLGVTTMIGNHIYTFFWQRIGPSI